MKKKMTLTVLMLVTVILAACYQGNYNDESEFEVESAANGKSLVITKYTGKWVLDIKVPPKINGKRVTEIGKSAFFNYGVIISSVTIPNGIKKIGEWAFSDNLLYDFKIPKSVTEIGPGAFMSNQLTAVTIPNSVKKIGYRAFCGNPLTSITIGANVELETLSGYDTLLESEWAYPAFELGYEVEFDDFYHANGRKAGTYVADNGAWIYQGK